MHQSLSQSPQEAITEWFNDVYQTRGYAYLRPMVAYGIFLKLLNPEPQKLLLDVACGPGLLLSHAKQRQLNSYGIDISKKAIQMAEGLIPSAKVMVANAENLPFRKSSFDYITCIGSLERMLNLEMVLKELLRVTQNDAKFCFMTRNSRSLSWYLLKCSKWLIQPVTKVQKVWTNGK